MSFKTLESIPLLFGLGISSFIFSGSNGTFFEKITTSCCGEMSKPIMGNGTSRVETGFVSRTGTLEQDVHDCFPTKYFSISWWQFGDPGSTSETSPVEEPLLKRICFCSTCPQTPGMFRTNTNSSP